MLRTNVWEAMDQGVVILYLILFYRIITWCGIWHQPFVLFIFKSETSFPELLEGGMVLGNFTEFSLVFHVALKNVVACSLRFPGSVALPALVLDLLFPFSSVDPILLNFDSSFSSFSSVWGLSWKGALICS